MNFISFPLAYDDRITSQEILRTRREKLGLSQQQVAKAAKLQLRQYQRIESGERNLETATLRTALAICAVLKLDPYAFFPEGEVMNKYIEISSKQSATSDIEETLTTFLQQACELYNDYLDINYSLDNIKVAFCTLGNIVEVYNEFTQKYGFHSEKRIMSDFESVLAEAFVGQTDIDDPAHVDGLMIRVDPPQELADLDYYKIILVHELAHIFCTTHEIETAGKVGQRFYDLYCAGTPETPSEEYNDGRMNAGYAIWREFIAEIVQDLVYQQPSLHLNEISKELHSIAKKVKVGNPLSKSLLHRYLSAIMNSREGSEAEKWEDLEKKLNKMKMPFMSIIHHVFDMVNNECGYKITPDDIETLGSLYMAEMIKNTPPEDLAKFAESYGLM